MCGAPISADDGARWAPACTLARLREQKIVCVTVDGASLIVIGDGASIHACERACPHEQADLGRGHLVDGRLHCPRHLAWFDLASGAISPGWSSRPLRRYAVRIDNGTVFVDRHDLAAA